MNDRIYTPPPRVPHESRAPLMLGVVLVGISAALVILGLAALIRWLA